MTSREKRQRGVHATEEGKGLLRLAQGQLRQENGRKTTYEHLAEISQLDQSTIGRFFRGEKVDEDSARVICQILGLDYSKVVDCKTALTPAQNENHDSEARAEGNWPAICRTMLERQRRLTTNEWLAQPDSHFEIDDIHMPLALLERRTRERRSPRNEAAQGFAGYEASEIQEVQKFKYADFLNTILHDREGRTSGQRVAIIGEPGAGKTTLLQKIAFWILDNQLGLPIWISLADLQLKNNRLEDLGDYLREVWLKRAVGLVTPEIQADFLKQVQQGQVWLLLDGLDELSLPFASVLRQMRDLLQGWISTARVVLTCRVNVWEASLNALDQFETYRIGSFSPEQMQGFIQKWFAHQDPTQPEKLWQALNDSRNTRIRDLVKSPLRLTLLCSTWQEDTALPETKAALYERFVEALYRWKSDRFSISRSDRKALDKALGELAKHAIDKGQSAYRLTQRQLDTYLDESTQRLSLELGWLNSIGVAEENKIEELFSFTHPTFQEYFAALAIDDSDFFFNPDVGEITKRSYRIFEERWREPLLVWFGLRQVEKIDKESLLRRLLYFNDECGKLYEYHVVFIAASCLSEFRDSEYKEEILDQVFFFAFGAAAEKPLRSFQDGEIIGQNDCPFDWIDHHANGQTQEKILSGEIPITDSIEYTINFLNRIFQYWYFEFIFNSKEKINIGSRENLLNHTRKSPSQRILPGKFKGIDLVTSPRSLPSFISPYYVLEKISAGNKQTINFLNEKLESINEIFASGYKEDRLWELIEKIDDDLNLLACMAGLLTKLDPDSKTGFTTLKMVALISFSEEDNALHFLFELAKSREFEEGDIDPIGIITYHAFLTAEGGMVEFNLLNPAIMIATALQRWGKDIWGYLEELFLIFPNLNSKKYLENEIVNTVIKYIEACCLKSESLASSSLKEMKEYSQSNSFHESIDINVAEISRQGSIWWRMPTREEKENNTALFWSAIWEDKPHPLADKIDAAKSGNDEAFRELLTLLNPSKISNSNTIGSGDFIPLINGARFSATVSWLKRDFVKNRAAKSIGIKYASGTYFNILFHCAENMPYEQFLAAWQYT